MEEPSSILKESESETFIQPKISLIGLSLPSAHLEKCLSERKT